jgi:muramoyltetrapeptide carboxypeptidase
MVKPRALARGDRLALVAPASAFKREQFDRGIDELRRLGFDPVYQPAVLAQHLYLAGSPSLRADDIHAAWRDAGVAGLVGVRGGYGSAQVLPFLNREELARSPKAFVGYSDLTAMLTFLTIHCGMVAFHGPTVAGRLSRGGEGYDAASFLNALTRREPLGELTGDSLTTIREGEREGVLLGGTLTQLVASLGTPFAFDPPPGYVLFLDEVGERPYRLDRMVTQLQQSGVLSKAAAIVIGELPNCDEPAGGRITARIVMEELFRDFPGPVVIGFPSGHTSGPALTLPLGVRARVIGGPRPRLVIEESAVE